MSTKIMNGGIWAGIARAAKEDGAKLNEQDEARLKMLEDLPKNEWINLDDNGNPITKEQAKLNRLNHLKKFKTK